MEMILCCHVHSVLMLIYLPYILRVAKIIPILKDPYLHYFSCIFTVQTVNQVFYQIANGYVRSPISKEKGIYWKIKSVQRNSHGIDAAIDLILPNSSDGCNVMCLI